MQQLSALQRLDLTDNALTGPISAELGQLGALTVLWLNDNELSGAIPTELGQRAALEFLYLAGNQQLTGQEALRGYIEEHNGDCELYL
jgi:Leucine-rich repeat (LRR) protein